MSHRGFRDEVFGSGAMSRATLSRQEKAGRLRRLGRGVYTNNIVDPVEEVVARNLGQIASILFPGAVISDRSFVEGVPTQGEIYLVADRSSEVEIAPLTYRARKGPGPQEGDQPFLDGLYLASPARGLLDNARLTRGRGARRSPTLSQPELEEWLVRELDRRGEVGLRRLREEARALAPALEAEKELKTVEQLIGAVLGTRSIDARSPLLRARQQGLAYDEQRLELFRALRDHLRASAPEPVTAAPTEGRERHLPFFEAYFSNFIEGTEFTLEEAIEIVYRHQIPASRPIDAHDILGTFQLVADLDEMSRTPTDADDFLELLRSRHAQMLHRRPDVQPGVFKSEQNRASSTIFVHPDKVLGTLVKGFDVYRELDDPFARAVFMMFLVSEVHPFNDGNGRIARVQMNAELVAAGQERIIVPQRFRNDYLSSLTALSLAGRVDVLPRVLHAAQRFTNTIDFSTVADARAQLEAKDAFRDRNELSVEAQALSLDGARRLPPPADSS